MPTIGEELKEFDRKISTSRKMSRTAIFRLIILSASIVGFSVSLFSIPALQSNLDFGVLQYSWYFFLGVIILGFFILMFEGRIKYSKTWKGFQGSEIPDEYDYTLKEKIFASLITIATLFYPANLFFNRIYKDKNEKIFKERVNGLVVQKLATIEHQLIFLENIVFILFICGLISLILSVS